MRAQIQFAPHIAVGLRVPSKLDVSCERLTPCACKGPPRRILMVWCMHCLHHQAPYRIASEVVASHIILNRLRALDIKQRRLTSRSQSVELGGI